MPESSAEEGDGSKSLAITLCLKDLTGFVTLALTAILFVMA